MSSLLDNFRRQLLTTALHDGVDLKLRATQASPGLFESRCFRLGERCLYLGCRHAQGLIDATGLIGPRGYLQVVSRSISHVIELRRSLAAGFSSDALPPIRILCANYSDLRVDLEIIDDFLAEGALRSLQDLERLNTRVRAVAGASPAVRDGSFDAILLDADVQPGEELGRAVFREACRVLRPGGRFTIRLPVSDEPIPASCPSAAERPEGARLIPTEEQFFTDLRFSQFEASEIVHWEAFPRELVHGVEIRNITVRAYSSHGGECRERNQAVIYRGPWQSVTDDSGNTYHRGRRAAVDAAAYKLLTSEPYGASLVAVPPYHEVPIDNAAPFTGRGQRRDPKVTKSTTRPPNPNSCCGPSAEGDMCDGGPT
jgi:arsenite methyltransferase